MRLIGISDSKIENNRIDSLGNGTAVAKTKDKMERQVILLKNCSAVEIKGNTLYDPEGRMKADANSQSPLLGLDGTQDIIFNGERLKDVPQHKGQIKTE